ncbi:MAG: hypothetical protein ACKV2O_11345 [Acidimicrobiales bacterium]
MKALTFSTTDLDRLHTQLIAWRQRQTGRARLPAELWRAATHLAHTHGVGRVARTLRLDYYKLRRQTQGGATDEPARSTPPGFIELKLPAPPPGAPLPPAAESLGWVELHDGSPRRLRVYTGHAPAAWVALAEAFWRQHP